MLVNINLGEEISRRRREQKLIINNAYRAKKIKPEKIHDNNTPVFMKKLLTN